MRRFPLGLLAGCFDCFHAGHAWFLAEAAKHCESLAALVASDEAICILKHREPIDSWKVRVANVRLACPSVVRCEPIEDHGEQTLGYWARKINPDLLIVADDQLHIPDKLQVACDRRVPVLVLPRSPLPISTRGIVAMSSSGILPINECPGFKAKWNLTQNAVLENLDYGTIRHRVVIKPDGSCGHDQPHWIGPGGAVGLPIDEAGRIGLISAYRPFVLKQNPEGNYPDYPTSDFGEWLWEASRGFRDPGETAEVTFSRELSEEAGLKVVSREHVGCAYMDSAFMATPVQLFIANVTGAPKPQVAEGIREVRFFDAGEVVAMITRGEIRCGITLAVLAHYLTRKRE